MAKLSRKQLAALAKGRAVRKKKLAAKKRRRKAAPKKRAKKATRKRVARNPARKKARRKTARKSAPKKRARKSPRKKRAVKKRRVSSGVFIYARKGKKGKRFYLKKQDGVWNFGTVKPTGLRGKEISNAENAAKKLAKKLPPGFDLYISGKKK